MNFSVKFYQRDFGEFLQVPQVTWNVTRFSHSVKGGPLEASISVRGTEVSLQDVIEMLRCPVEIFDEYGDCVWWGYIRKVSLSIGKTTISVTIDSMSNTIQALYSTVAAGQVTSQAATTAWVSDSVSVSEYGTKQLRMSLNDMTADAALQQVNTKLARVKYPTPQWDASGQQNSLSGLLECEGWWRALNWKYYSQLSGLEAYQEGGDGTQNVGSAASNTTIVQTFQLGSPLGWTTNALGVRCRKGGTPTDNLKLELLSNTDVVLASTELTPSNMGTTFAWMGGTLNTTVALATGTTYKIRVTRTGSVSSTNYFAVDVNSALGYPRGVLTVNGVPRSPDADLLFRVTGVTQTSEQIPIAISDYNQFIVGATVEPASGLYTTPYRNGRSSYQQCLTDLLELGTTNSRRYISKVDRNRRLAVTEEPSPTDSFKVYGMNKDLDIFDPNDVLIPKYKMPVGVWVKLKDVLLPSADMSRLADPTLMFVDEMSYDIEYGMLGLTMRDNMTTEDVGKVKDG